VAKLTLFLLGQPRIECDGALLVVDTRKAIALLAYIAVTQQPHSREALATLLHSALAEEEPDAPPAKYAKAD